MSGMAKQPAVIRSIILYTYDNTPRTKEGLFQSKSNICALGTGKVKYWLFRLKSELACEID